MSDKNNTVDFLVWPVCKKIARLLIIYLLLFSPIFLSQIYIRKVSVNRSISVTRFSALGVSAQPIKEIAGGGVYTLKADDQLIQGVQYSRLLNIQPDIINYKLYIGHNIAIRIRYRTDTDQNYITRTFPFEEACDDKSIKTDSGWVLMAQGLSLANQTRNDREDIEKIFNNCFYSVTGSVFNSTGETLYVNDFSLAPNSKIDLILEPDFISKVIVFLSIYALWWGFWVLFKESLAIIGFIIRITH